MSTDPFFIVGPARSGTTLLEQIINRHSRLYVPPETAFFHRLRRQGLLEHEFSVERMRAFFDSYFSSKPVGLWEKVPTSSEYSLLLDRAKSYVEVFLRLAEWLRERSGKARIGEKTPGHLVCAEYLLKHIPSAKFIGIIRDGRAVVRSRLTYPGWEHNIYSAAVTWRDDAILLKNLVESANSHRVHLVKYEVLIEEPENTIYDICKFLGEEFEPNLHMPAGAASANISPGSKFYQRPWMAKSTKALDPSRISSWIKEYSPAELALVENIMVDEMRHFGYLPVSTGGETWRPLLVREMARHALFRVHRFAGLRRKSAKQV